jgi:hypothetical protein
MRVNTSIWALFAAENRFICLTFRYDSPVAEAKKKISGMYLTVTGNGLLWHRSETKKCEYPRVAGGTRLWVLPEGLDAATGVDEDTYYASCVSKQQWLAQTPVGTRLPLAWWSAMEGVHDQNGYVISLGSSVNSDQSVSAHRKRMQLFKALHHTVALRWTTYECNTLMKCYNLLLFKVASYWRHFVSLSTEISLQRPRLG